VSAYEVYVASHVDREDLFVEICLGDDVFAEVRNKDGQVLVEWFPGKEVQYHVCADLIDVLNWAREQICVLGEK
jgi:hypothetical protein